MNSPFTLRFLKLGCLAAMGMLLTASDLLAANTLLYPLVDLGYAGRSKDWAIFSMGGGINISDSVVDPSNPAVAGNIANAGTVGGISMNTSAVVGSSYSKTGGTLTQTGGATIYGSTNQGTNDANLSSGYNSAVSASNSAWGFANSPLSGNTYSGANAGMLGLQPTIINTNAPLTLTGSGNVVLHLTDFLVSNNATLTLSGDASTTFIVNVTGKFFLTGGKVVLSGGLTWDNVLFNIRGTGLDASLSSGAQLAGFVLATQRSVTLSGGSIIGKGTVIANKINLSGGSKIIRPANPSPF